MKGPKAPRSAPSRRKPSAASRLRRFWIPIVLVAGVLAIGAAFVVLWPGFCPQRVDVSGNRTISRDEIVARSGIAANENIWLQDPRAIAARVESIPYVARARVRRLPPATIEIAVEERVPFAVVRSGAAAAIVDRDLRVLQVLDGEVALPELLLGSKLTLQPGAFVTGSGAGALRDDDEAMVAAHVLPVALAHDRFGGLVATLRGGVQLLLGDEDDLQKKLPLVDPILAQVVRKGRPVAAIDLRAPNTPVLVYRN